MAYLEHVGVKQTVITFILSVLAAMGYAGEIRCYCNLSVCVSTGYMCKSSSSVDGVCFSEVSGDGDVAKARHGCLHLLKPAKREVCQQRSTTNQVLLHLQPSASAAYPLLFCCSADMCNYMDCLDVNIHIHTKPNHTAHPSTGVSGSSTEEREVMFGNAAASQPANGSPMTEVVARQDLWFKAAVIAVPIAGGFILIMLILLAVHLLRKDNRRHRQMLELKRLKQLRSRLLLDDDHHGQHPLDGQLPQLHRQHHSSACVYDNEHKKNVVKTNQHNIYKNVNLAISRDNKNYCVMVNSHVKQLAKDTHRYDYNLLLDKPLNTDSSAINTTNNTTRPLPTSNWDDYRQLNHDKYINNNHFKSSTPV